MFWRGTALKPRPEDERLRAPEPPEQLRTPAPTSGGAVKQTKQQIIRLMRNGALQRAFPGTGGLTHYTPDLSSAGCSSEAEGAAPPETTTRNAKGTAGHDGCSLEPRGEARVGTSSSLPCYSRSSCLFQQQRLTCSDMSRARNFRWVIAGYLSLRAGSVVQRMKREGRISVSILHFSFTTLTQTL